MSFLMMDLGLSVPVSGAMVTVFRPPAAIFLRASSWTASALKEDTEKDW